MSISADAYINGTVPTSTCSRRPKPGSIGIASQLDALAFTTFFDGVADEDLHFAYVVSHVAQDGVSWGGKSRNTYARLVDTRNQVAIFDREGFIFRRGVPRYTIPMTPQMDAIEIRRRLHRYPEPFWREFHTTSLLVDELERIGVDEIHIGPDAIAVDERLGVPDHAEICKWRQRAAQEGAREDVLAATEGGVTGVVGVVRCGRGPTIGLRVDIDGLYQDESTAESHRPASEGFRSEHDGMMHACGHDASTAIGIGVLDRLRESGFEGTFVVFFQPASEIEGGGKPMAMGPHAEDVDYLLVINVGFGHPTGEVVAGVDGMYAIERFRAEFAGEAAHAAKSPDDGRNAIQAMTAAVGDLYAIPRHADGPTRVNVGTVEAGRATNLVADQATIEGEIRGETTALLRSMQDRAEQILDGGARMHDCEVTSETIGEAPSTDSDEVLADLVYGILDAADGVTAPVRRAGFGTGEDAAWLMNAVSARNGLATHVVVGTDHPTGHHTPTFDIDEASIEIGVDTIVRAAFAIDRGELSER